MCQVRLHVAQARDAAAEVALGGAATVDELVRREAREEDFWVRWVWVALSLLRDEKVAEDELAGAQRGAVLRQRGQGWGLVPTGGAGVWCVGDVCVFCLAGCVVAVSLGMLVAVPVVLPLG